MKAQRALLNQNLPSVTSVGSLTKQSGEITQKRRRFGHSLDVLKTS
ncbi:MAG: hypothetical protein LBF66_00375 [Holosporales bacterium]|nr:hypothetical protein [Holosporales bacterium]